MDCPDASILQKAKADGQGYSDHHHYFPTRHRHDPDNYNGKMLMDGLTDRGVIADDSFDHIELRLRGEYDRQNPRTEITIEEVLE